MRVFQWYKDVWFRQSLPPIFPCETFENWALQGNLFPFSSKKSSLGKSFSPWGIQLEEVAHNLFFIHFIHGMKRNLRHGLNPKPFVWRGNILPLPPLQNIFMCPFFAYRQLIPHVIYQLCYKPQSLTTRSKKFLGIIMQGR